MLAKQKSDLKKKRSPRSDTDKVDALLEAFALFCERTASLESAFRELKVEQNNLNLFIETLIASMVQALLFLDEKGTILLMNSSMAQLLDKTEASYIGCPYQEAISDTFFGFSISEALTNGPIAPFYRITNQEKILEIEPTLLENGSHRGLLLLVRDATEIRRQEEVALQNERLKELGELASQVAHEIRNPLGGIKGYAGLLVRDLAEKAPKLEKMARSIVAAADDLNQLVSQILTYAKSPEPHFSNVKILPILKEIQSLIEFDPDLLQKPKIIIEAEPKLSASLDPFLIKAAILNLAINACQAMINKPGVLTLRGYIKEEMLLIEVEDTGPGIPPELHKKIFSPFFTTKSNGTGLGLAEVTKNVKIHGGRIELKSEVGKGSLFQIQIPTIGKL